MYEFRLYIAGDTPLSKRSVDNVRRFLDDHFSGDYYLDIIDLLEAHYIAEYEEVIATPTLMKLSPDPGIRFVGDMRCALSSPLSQRLLTMKKHEEGKRR